MHTFTRYGAAVILSSLVVGGLPNSTSSACNKPIAPRSAIHLLKPNRKSPDGLTSYQPGLRRRVPHPDTSNGFVTHRDMASILGISRSQLYRWLRRPDFPDDARPKRRRGQRLYSPAAQLALIAYRDRVEPA